MLSSIFCCFFHEISVFIIFISFLTKYQIPEENINQSEKGICGPELSVELYELVTNFLGKATRTFIE